MGLNLAHLRNLDGSTHVRRWGWDCKLGGVFLHRFENVESGDLLHDHEWTFVTIKLKGGYVEERASIRRPDDSKLKRLRFFSVCRLDECHRISAIEKPTWTLLIHGPKRRRWGVYRYGRWIWWKQYEEVFPPLFLREDQ